MKEGIIVVNKPEGMTSHDVVDFVRKKLKTRRVGHAGTLDPIATGVLLILVGRYTKLFNHFLDFDKEYLATLTLGERTTSGDREGRGF
jgi:tRNA pseudouridine55 synthase